jgi:G3E family GTPase
MHDPPITIISGFLGSGKTTLLRRLLEEHRHGRRLALIVNEFGEIGIDGRLLEDAAGPALVELSGGCVCCVAGSDFLLAVAELIDAVAPDQIVIETSGLADPLATLQQVRTAGLPLDAIVTVVDGLNLEPALAATPLTTRQIGAADLLLLSKVDLIDPPQRHAVEQRLRTLNRRAAIVPVAHGAVDPNLIFGPVTTRADRPLALAAVHDHTDFDTYVWQSPHPLHRETLTATLTELAPLTLRIKGLVQCSDAPWADEVHVVGERIDLRAVRLRARPDLLNQLVLIGTGMAEYATVINARLDACADNPERRAAWYAREA